MRTGGVEEGHRDVRERVKQVTALLTAPLRTISPRRWTRRGVLTGIAVGLLAGFGVGGLAQVHVETSMSSFLPANDPAVTQMQAKERSFGSDPVVVLLESNKPRELLNPQHLKPVVNMEGKLSKLPDVASVYGPGTTLNQIAGQAQDFLAELMGRRDAAKAQAVAQAKTSGASDGQAQKAGDQALQQFDARYGPLLVQGMPSGLPTLKNPQFVNSVIYTHSGTVRPQWRFVVPSQYSMAVLVRPRANMDAAATSRLVDNIRQVTGASQVHASKITVSGTPVVASAVSNEVSQEMLVIGGLAVITVGACFLLVPWTRWKKRLLPLIATLIAICLTLALFGWLGKPLSLGVVAFLPVLLGIGSYYPTYFARRAKKRVVLTVACASAASLSTLALSPLPFVRDLGMTLGIGVLASACVGLVLLRPVAFTAGSEDVEHEFWAPSLRRKRGVVATGGAVTLVLAVVGWSVLPGLPLQADVESFAAGLGAMNDAKHVEQQIGSSGEADVVLRGPNTSSPQALDWMHKAQDRIVSEHGDQMHPILSLPSLLRFLGNQATGEQINSALRLLPHYLTSAVMRGDDKSSVMIFGVNMDDVQQIRELRQSVMQDLPAPPPGYDVQLTGLPMVAVRGEQIISEGRVLANIVGIAAAGVVLALGLRRRSDALRAVAAASIATGVGLFALWATGIPLSPITVGLGSLTAAIGCEFTVMLSESVRSGNRGLRLSVLLATAASATGYAVLSFSELGAIRQFGILLSGSVLLALGSSVCVVVLTTSLKGKQNDVNDNHVATRVKRLEGVET